MDASLQLVGLQMSVQVLRRSLEQQEQLALRLIESTGRSDANSVRLPEKDSIDSASDSSAAGHIDIRV